MKRTAGIFVQLEYRSDLMILRSVFVLLAGLASLSVSGCCHYGPYAAPYGGYYGDCVMAPDQCPPVCDPCAGVCDPCVGPMHPVEHAYAVRQARHDHHCGPRFPLLHALCPLHWIEAMHRPFHCSRRPGIYGPRYLDPMPYNVCDPCGCGVPCGCDTCGSGISGEVVMGDGWTTMGSDCPTCQQGTQVYGETYQGEYFPGPAPTYQQPQQGGTESMKPVPSPMPMPSPMQNPMSPPTQPMDPGSSSGVDAVKAEDFYMPRPLPMPVLQGSATQQHGASTTAPRSPVQPVLWVPSGL